MSQGERGYDCAKALDELDAFVRGELPLDEVERMRVHLDRCGHCASVASYERAFRERLKTMQRSCGCPDQLRERIRQLLAREHPDADQS